ncbi:allantoinase [Phalaenopsis equestris]|uniref:allantoinase n=1 Tax=Phalaenopsis equestris TaxID=78828 RepID=UPI0009E3719A|nr:allantoinase [Phalaenopsis equestris]
MGVLRRWILPLLFVLVSVLLYFKTSHKVSVLQIFNFSSPFFYFFYEIQANGGCSLLSHDEFWIRSNRIVTPEGVFAGAVEVKGGRIASVVSDDYSGGQFAGGYVVDYGNAVVMPGFVDIHVHLDEPGRTEWEGFSAGTKAAAAGGVTTLIDMPLNSFPVTVTEEALKLKVEAAREKIYVDVGFWGGLVPENALNTTILDRLLRAGVLGLKSFMLPSGINDFPMTNITHIKEGLYTLAKYKRPLLVHAEVNPNSDGDGETIDAASDPRSYSTYLKTRPASWEIEAISELRTAMEETKVGGPAEGAHVHIVHLSDAGTSLNLIKEAKSSGASVSVETCAHYLAFSAEEIKDGDTRFKCAPPIRDEANRQKLREALLEGDIDMLSSDHSPTTPELKLLKEGDFLRAWGGVSSLQFDLPATWHYGKTYGLTLRQLVKYWSERPAKFAGQEHKGAILPGKDADFVVWDPEVEFELDGSYKTFSKHPNISAYMGKTLSGKVLATFVRGNLVFSDGIHSPNPCGETILAK